jgi:hypothetical protein
MNEVIKNTFGVFFCLKEERGSDGSQQWGYGSILRKRTDLL